MKTMPLTLLTDTPDSQRIDKIHVWIGITRDGGEGILSADVPMFGTVRHVALVSSKRHVAESMRPLVDSLKDMAAAQNHFIEVELRTFARE